MNNIDECLKLLSEVNTRMLNFYYPETVDKTRNHQKDRNGMILMDINRKIGIFLAKWNEEYTEEERNKFML